MRSAGELSFEDGETSELNGEDSFKIFAMVIFPFSFVMLVTGDCENL